MCQGFSFRPTYLVITKTSTAGADVTHEINCYSATRTHVKKDVS